ncbi:hypothetical protein [Colwellia echini]|uniref:Uncharacterized protein n=1 Tax=Colwellia echini TaxID=1982103 RepID=A0ABY3MUT9_9GAMM|nr:hypothetical protein [Colwellia echini]TYK64973.1 hypothetical protein CWS31_012660 [Colwellia echini]
MNFLSLLLLGASLTLLSLSLSAESTKKSAARDISHLISKEEFLTYQDVADFIEQSPKVMIIVPASAEDIEKYGPQVAKSLTGSDCDRDGEMDDNPRCNAVFFKLWMKYAK